MLPDYPKAKKKIQNQLLRNIERAAYKGPLDLIKKYKFDEGHCFKVEFVDGESDIVNAQEIETSVSIDLNSYEELEPEEIFMLMEKCGDDLNDSIQEMVFKTLKQYPGDAFNSVKVKGEIKPEDIINIIEKSPMDFEKSGRPIYPAIGCHPKSELSAVKAWNDLMKLPEYKKKLEDLIKKKWSEWIDRENSRKLVG